MHQGVLVVPNSLTAVLGKQPCRRGDRFLVSVDVEAAPGCTIELVAAVPQGINPSIKLLRLRVDAPTQPQGAPHVRYTLRYEEAPAAADYRDVWLGRGDAAISAKVVLAV